MSASQSQTQTQQRPRIYIAGPMSKGDRIANLAAGLTAYRELIREGFAPFSPHLSFLVADLIQDDLQMTHQKWLDIDLPWVEVANAVLRLPGNSKGADMEIVHARNLGVPVFHDIKDVVEAKDELNARSFPSGYTVSAMVDESWMIAEAKGFHDGRGADRDDTLLRLCLVHTEVSEAAQIVKRKWPQSGVGQDDKRVPYHLREEFAEELADVLIRVGDLARCVGIDGYQLSRSILQKHEKNRNREHKYGTPHAEAVAKEKAHT